MAEGLPGISLVIPAHNEESSIYDMVSESVAVLEKLGREYEVIVVDDGSTDGTAGELLRAIGNFEHVTAIELTANLGKGNALKRGFEISSMDLVCFIDADLDLHPCQIKRLLAVMENERADVVIGSKRHPQSKINYPWYRKLYSNIYYLLVRTLFHLPLKDTQTGIKIARREVMEDVFARAVCKQYTLDLEMLAIANSLGYRISEAPVDLNFHAPFGSIRWRDIRNIIVDTMGIFYRFYILVYYGCPLKPPGDSEPSVSIIVPTREIDAMTEECLQKCCDLNYSQFDVKLLPDYEVQADLPSAIQVITTGPVGPSVKRNIGAAASDSDILAFIDADAWPEAEWLRNAAAYFEDDDVCGVCGPALTPPDDSMAQQAGGLVYSSSLVSGNTTFRYTCHALRDVDDYPSCNLLIKRKDFEAAGGFPEEYWPGEDTVLCMRLTKDAGKRLIYVPNVVVAHHRRPLYRQHMRQVYAYARHRGYFFRKFPANSRRLTFMTPSVFVLWLVGGLAGSFFFRPIKYVYLAVMALYLTLVTISSMKTLDVKVNAMVFLGIIATNVTYGVGFISGLLSSGMEKS